MYQLLTNFVVLPSISEVMLYDYVFAENGLVAYKYGELIGKQVFFHYIIIFLIFLLDNFLNINACLLLNVDIYLAVVRI